MDHWATLVRTFKDSENALGIEPRDSELLSLKILDFIRYTRIRQWTLFVQKRGDDYDKMIEVLRESGFQPEAIQRFVESEELWATTLEMGEH
jgi:flagellar biosynthesis regulator FlaF